MNRVVVLGCGGAGKTRFARALAERIGGTAVCLDAIWQPGWTADDVPAFREILRAEHAGERWVSDGNFAVASFGIRLPRADLVVWLEPPRLLCAWRAVRRVFRPGEAHRLKGLPDVLKFIWNFERVNRPRIEGLREKLAPQVPVVRLKSDREVAAFLARAQPGI